jgi:hypothetical protein
MDGDVVRHGGVVRHREIHLYLTDCVHKQTFGKVGQSSGGRGLTLYKYVGLRKDKCIFYDIWRKRPLERIVYWDEMSWLKNSVRVRFYAYLSAKISSADMSTVHIHIRVYMHANCSSRACNARFTCILVDSTKKSHAFRSFYLADFL